MRAWRNHRCGDCSPHPIRLSDRSVPSLPCELAKEFRRVISRSHSDRHVAPPEVFVSGLRAFAGGDAATDRKSATAAALETIPRSDHFDRGTHSSGDRQRDQTSATLRPIYVLVPAPGRRGIARASSVRRTNCSRLALGAAARVTGAPPTEGADGADRAGGAETRGAGIDPPRLEPEDPIGAALLPPPLPSTGTVPATAAPHESSSHATDTLRNVFMARISRSESPRKTRVAHCFARLRISVSIRCSARADPRGSRVGEAVSLGGSSSGVELRARVRLPIRAEELEIPIKPQDRAGEPRRLGRNPQRVVRRERRANCSSTDRA